MNGFGQWLVMGGYGLYVWGSIGATLGLMALEAALLWRRARALAQVRVPGAPR